MKNNVYSDLNIKGLGEIYTLTINTKQKVEGALLQAINFYGGEENFKNLLAREKIFDVEKARIKNEIIGLMSDQMDSAFLKTLILSDILSKDELTNYIDSVAKRVQEEKTNNTLDPTTLFMSLIGILIGTIIGSIITILQIIYTGDFLYFSLIFMFLISAVSLRISTKKNLGNVVVLIGTIMATILGPLSAFFIAELFRM